MSEAMLAEVIAQLEKANGANLSGLATKDRLHSELAIAKQKRIQLDWAIDAAEIWQRADFERAMSAAANRT